MNTDTNKPLNTFSLEQSLYYGKNLFQNLVRNGANAKQIVQVIDGMIEGINKQIGLDCYKGDVNDCNLDEQTKLCFILNEHLAQLNKLSQALLTQGAAGGGGAAGTPAANSNFVTVKNDATETPGPLQDKLKSNQPNGLTYNATDKTLNTGTFVPPGSVFLITKRYLVNFDTTGLGKVATDFYPFAIADGRNGTDNLLKDVYLKFLSNTNDADQEGGLDGFTVKGANIESLTMGITGVINESLIDHTLRVDVDTKVGGLVAGSTILLAPVGGSIPNTGLAVVPPWLLKHSHTHSLSAAHQNPTPTAIPLNPKFIKLVPIQTIKR